jgi:hypothetical protein
MRTRLQTVLLQSITTAVDDVSMTIGPFVGEGYHVVGRPFCRGVLPEKINLRRPNGDVK